MYFDPLEEIAGVKLRDLRGVFRLLNCGDRSFYIEWLCDRLKLDPMQGQAVLEALIGRGFVVKHQGSNVPTAAGLHEMTDTGSFLANAHFTKRFSRATAARIIEAVQNRAAEVNAESALPTFVGEIKVFGSWLSEKPDLGDVDLAVGLQRRYQGKDFTRLNLLWADRDEFRGSWVQRLFYADTLAYRRIKGRDGRISIHRMDEIKTFGTATQRIFRADVIARENAALLIERIEEELVDETRIVFGHA
jgi:hypothetical protein